jgi:HemY protein
VTKLLWLLALFALAVGIALAARFNEGYLLLVLPPYRAEVSLNLAIFLVVSIFVVVHGLLRTIGLTLALPNRVQAFRERRRRAKAAEAFHDAVRLLFEGRFGRALKKAGEAHAAAHSPGLAALLAARAAQLLREPDTEKAWLERVRRDDPRLESARLMVEAEMFLDTGDFEAALITLQGLQRLTGRRGVAA